MLDLYLIPGIDILKNGLGIKAEVLSEKAEEDIIYLKLLDIDAWFENKQFYYETFLTINFFRYTAF